MKTTEIKDFIDSIWVMDKPEVNLARELETHLINLRCQSDLEIQLELDESLVKVRKILAKRIQDSLAKFISPVFVFTDYSDNSLVRYDLTKKTSEEKKTTSLKIERRGDIFHSLKSLNWREFESLAKWILDANNVRDIVITQSVNDNGIDFYGLITFNTYLPINFRLGRDINLRLVGQSKHSVRSNQVGHQKVSSFATEIRKLRKGNQDGYFTCIDDNFFNHEFPIIGLFLTNTAYSPKSVNFAAEYGIIIWDGEQISEDLATKQFIDVVEDVNGRIDLKQLWK